MRPALNKGNRHTVSNCKLVSGEHVLRMDKQTNKHPVKGRESLSREEKPMRNPVNGNEHRRRPNEVANVTAGNTNQTGVYSEIHRTADHNQSGMVFCKAGICLLAK